MPIIVSVSSPGFSTAASDIINAVSQDVRQQLASTGSDTTILLDYINRISLKLLRQSNWNFILSAPQRFITRVGANDYWLGTVGTAPVGSYDTGLNLNDLRTVKPETVFDRSNYLIPGRYDDAPLSLGFATRDDISTLGIPRAFKVSPDNPYLFSLYPAPDNQNTYQPVPEPPLCLTTGGGALASRTYFVKLTLVDSNGGESTPNTVETPVVIPANSLLQVKSPVLPFTTTASGVQYTGYKVYAGTTSGGELLQNGGASITFGTDFTESVGGLSTGTAAVPTTSTLASMGGYLIEFRYYKKRVKIVAASQILQVPDDFFDIVVAGVNQLAYTYLQKMDQAMTWGQIFREGVREMIRDKQLFPEATSDFMRPDSASSTASKIPLQTQAF